MDRILLNPEELLNSDLNQKDVYTLLESLIGHPDNDQAEYYNIMNHVVYPMPGNEKMMKVILIVLQRVNKKGNEKPSSYFVWEQSLSWENGCTNAVDMKVTTQDNARDLSQKIKFAKNMFQGKKLTSKSPQE